MRIYGDRYIASLLSGLLLGLPVVSIPRAVRAQETAEAQEVFNFTDVSTSTPTPLLATGAKNATKQRTAPVSATGSFQTSIPIQVPPGRGDMTPSLALSYDSAAFRSDSAVGAGWSFGVSAISRSTKNGYPPLRRTSGTLAYDDDKAVFASPAGELVRWTGASSQVPSPSYSDSRFYVPLRETSPVRYEYSPSRGHWVEHLPGGTKRHYGLDPLPWSPRPGAITNELGTFSWLLLSEIDVDGNTISYDYHWINDAWDGQHRSNKTYPRDPSATPG